MKVLSETYGEERKFASLQWADWCEETTGQPDVHRFLKVALLMGWPRKSIDYPGEWLWEKKNYDEAYDRLRGYTRSRLTCLKYYPTFSEAVLAMMEALGP